MPRSLVCSLYLQLAVITPIAAKFYTKEVTTIAPGNTQYWPFGAINGATGQGLVVTVRSDPPDGTVTVTTSAASLQSDGAGAVTATTTTTGTFTTIINPARSIPTLVYNCAFMPFICKNIANHVANQGNFKFDANGLMKLHLDMNTARNKNRRKGVCESPKFLWKAGGFPQKCIDAKTDLGIPTVYSNEYTLDAESVHKAMAEIIKGPVDPTDPTGQRHLFSGLKWTCDEFPSASWVEGGRGIDLKGIQSEVICAPMGATCGLGTKAKNWLISQAQGAAAGFSLGPRGTVNFRNPSEQDWQGTALSQLKNIVAEAYQIVGAPAGTNQGHPNDDFVGVFFLSTANLPAVATDSRVWIVDHAKVTRVYSRAAVETDDMDAASPTSQQSVTSTPVPTVTTTRARSTLGPAPTTTAPSPPRAATPPPAAPLWRRNKVKRRTLSPKGVHWLGGRAMSAAEVQSAQSVVALATKEQQTANARILAHPRVNHKESKNATSLVDMDPEYTVPEPTKADYRPANASVRAAAALVAEYEARNGLMEFTWPLDFDRSNSSTISNVTTGPFLGKRAASSYW